MSGFFKLNLADFLRGLIVAALSAGVTFLQQLLAASSEIHWKTVGGVALAAAVAYLVKNLASDSKGAVLGIQATAPPPAGNT